MICIFKYPIDLLKCQQAIKMNSGAKILCLHTQYQDKELIPMIWAMIETDNPIETRTFEIFATGQALISSERKRIHYVGSFQIENFVGHVFETKK